MVFNSSALRAKSAELIYTARDLPRIWIIHAECIHNATGMKCKSKRAARGGRSSEESIVAKHRGNVPSMFISSLRCLE